MALFRRRAPVEALMRSALQAVFRRDYRSALRDLETGGALFRQELLGLMIELPALDVAIWHLFFLQDAGAHAQPLPSFEVGRRFGLALGLAAADVRPNKEAALSEAEALIERSGRYVEAAVSSVSVNRTMDTCAGSMALALAARVLPDVSSRDAAVNGRWLQVVTISIESYRLIEAAFQALLREWKPQYS